MRLSDSQLRYVIGRKPYAEAVEAAANYFIKIEYRTPTANEFDNLCTDIQRVMKEDAATKTKAASEAYLRAKDPG